MTMEEIRENDSYFELDTSRCNCDLEKCLQPGTGTCEICYRGVCVCRDYRIDMPNRHCHPASNSKINATFLKPTFQNNTENASLPHSMRLKNTHSEFWLRNGRGIIVLWKKYIFLFECRQIQGIFF